MGKIKQTKKHKHDFVILLTISHSLCVLYPPIETGEGLDVPIQDPLTFGVR